MNKDKTKTKKLTKGEILEPKESETIPIEEVVKEEAVEEVHEETEVKEKDIRTITITIDHYENVVPLHPVSDIQSRCKYQETFVGETSFIPVTDNPQLVVDESFSFKVNINSKKDLDNLISTPALLTVFQYAGTCDPTLYEQLQKCENLKSIGSVKSFESVVSIYEAFTGDTVDRNIVDGAVKKTKGKAKKMEKKSEKKIKEKTSKSSTKASKPAKPSSALKKQKLKKTDTISLESELEVKPLVYGMCVLDFLPLFYGKPHFTECLIINPTEKFTDDRMTIYKRKPQVTVTVSIDKEICYANPTVLGVTLESIYNIPAVIRSDMDFKTCVLIPGREPIIFTNPTYSSRPFTNAMKSWPGIKRIGVEATTTKYKVGEHEIKNMTILDDIESTLSSSGSRLRYNTLKRNLLVKEGTDTFCCHVLTHRRILVEIYGSAKEKASKALESSAEEPLSVKGSNPSLTSVQKMKPSDVVTRKKSQNFLHLMAIVDISPLLYPGVTKVRVATPLTTFNYDEASAKVGATDSFFVPKPVAPVDLHEPSVADFEGPKNDKKSEKSKKREKSIASKSIKASKKGGRKTEEGQGDLKYLLPPEPEAPPEPEPITLVFSESGKQTFLIIEIELSQPITKKREVEDLSNELQWLLQEKKKNSSKIVLTHHLTRDYYREVLNRVTKDMYEKYKNYQSTKGSTITEKDFIKYLEGVGAYRTYLASIKEAVSLLTTTKFRLDDTDKKSSSQLFQNFISEIFVYLVAEMNDTLNRLICSGLEPVTIPKPNSADQLFIYAKEAAALKKLDLAERYFLERICYYETNNADYWFDYAVFNLEIKQTEKALECAIEALTKKPTHRNSLLFMGALLATKGQKHDAETCFLNLLIYEPRWVEGWVTLYLFYEKYDTYEGMDMAMDMVKKYLDDPRAVSDYFTATEDLYWTSEICPKTMFFRTAVLLLKMRLYEWVEMALAHEVQQHIGITHYLLSAICLYQEINEQALEHIQHAKSYCRPNYALSSLCGHCLYALKRQYEAREEYNHVLQTIDRTDNIHMVYVNCAQIWDSYGNHQEARKLMLLACKHTPTHYTWFRAGQMYLLQQDLLSAEECFSEANTRDNRCPEYWGYLTLINLQLNRIDEAELCYSQAVRNNLDEEMSEQLKKEFRKVNLMTEV